MISCVSPGNDSADHTINTLRYSDRLKLRKEALVNEKESASRQSLSKRGGSQQKKPGLALKPLREPQQRPNLTSHSNRVSDSVRKEEIELSLSIQNESFEQTQPIYDVFALHLNVVKEDASIVKYETLLLNELEGIEVSPEAQKNYLQQVEAVVQKKLFLYSQLQEAIRKFK